MRWSFACDGGGGVLVDGRRKGISGSGVVVPWLLLLMTMRGV